MRPAALMYCREGPSGRLAHPTKPVTLQAPVNADRCPHRIESNIFARLFSAADSMDERNTTIFAR
jgi:hypothetical protein